MWPPFFVPSFWTILGGRRNSPALLFTANTQSELEIIKRRLFGGSYRWCWHLYSEKGYNQPQFKYATYINRLAG